jgi:hypothetical protein
MTRYNQPPASQGPELAEAVNRDASIMATFPDMDEARTAIEELGRHGIEGQRVTLRGPGADEAATDNTFEHRGDNARADAQLVGRWAKRVAIGAALGAVVGAVLGIPVGIVVLELSDADVTGGTIAGSAFLGALFLSTIFALVSHVYQLPGQPDAWELTFHEADQPVVVGVHSQEPNDIEGARTVFERLGALEIREVGSGDSSRQPVAPMNRSAEG